MQAPDVIVVDFETHPIGQRPGYPPKPVGVAIKWPRRDGHYLAFGHPTANNCTLNDARDALDGVWQSGLPILCHHAKFDLAVAYERLGMGHLPWDRVHDTMFLGYLCDPHARKLGLKELAADLLGWPPDEQDEMYGWIWEHRATLEATYSSKVTKRGPGAWIFATPGDLCGRYAVGDVDRTAGLFEHLWPIVQSEGMGPAYDRERQLLPILMENEEGGMRADVPGLSRDVEAYAVALERAETWLRKELRASGLNFDADQDLAAVLVQRQIIQDADWTRTKPTRGHPSGQLSVSKENLLPEYFSDPRIASALGYRNRLKTCLSMFMEPWLEQAQQNAGYITTNWNQTRGDRGGTRTGRPSTDKHNFLNISKDFSGRDDGYVHPEFLGVRELPLCRKYILPDEGDVFLHRDFSGQELRVFANYEQGDLWEQYQADPRLDPHAFVGAEMQAVLDATLGPGVRVLERTKVKVLNFQSLYGGGVPALQRKLRCSYAEGKELKRFHDQALPGRVIMNEEIKKIVMRGEPIRTWGGRLFFPEKPGPDGRSKIYKLINYAIQGSAADITKQALIDWHGDNRRTARFMITVYDELDVSSPKGEAAAQMALLREHMEAPRLTVPMLSDGKYGPNWGTLMKGDPP